MPTLLQAAGLPKPEWCEGEALPLLGDREAGTERAVYSLDAKESSKFGPLAKRTVGLVRGRHKLVHYLGYAGYDDVYELYDLRDDPQELRNIYSPSSGIASDLKALLRQRSPELNRRV